MNEEALEIIEYNADTVLEEIGVNFINNPGALALWKDAGADIDGERVVSRVGLPAGFAPRHRQSSLSTRATPLATWSSAATTWCLLQSMAPPFVRDAEGGRRYATIEDFRKFVKLGYMSKWLHHSGGTVCEPHRCGGEQAAP